MNVCFALVRTAARLVPGDIRRDWTREWMAEVEYAFGRASTRRAKGARVVLVWRCAGAFVHALWLRWDRWRLEMLLQDIKYAFRTLAKKPAYAAVTILTLGIGIGANAAIFSAVHAVLLRPLPFPNPDELVQISSTTKARPTLPGGAASPPDFTDWRRSSNTLADMAAISAGSIPWSGHGTAEQVSYALVTGGFFNVLQVPAQHGRTLSNEDDAMGSPEVVVIAHSLWTRRLGGDPNVIGRTMVLDGVPRRVIGVMPRGFSYPPSAELWMPVRFTADDLATQRGALYLDVTAG
jgi:hypothetical protein